MSDRTVSHVIVEGPRRARLATMEVKSDDLAPGQAFVRTRRTLVSPGTETLLYTGGPMPSSIWEAFSTERGLISGGTAADIPNVIGPADDVCTGKYPIHTGYNAIGEVVLERESGFATGDRVLAMARHSSGFIAPGSRLIPIPDAVPDEAAAFAYLATLGLHALRQGRYAPGEKVAVVGAGLIGTLAARVAAALGVDLLVADVDPRRLARWQDGNLAVAVDPAAAGWEEAVARWAGHLGVSLVLETTGNWAAVNWAMRILNRGGRLVVMALHGGQPSFPLLGGHFYDKELQLIGTSNDPLLSTRGFSVRHNCSYILDLMARGRLRVDDLINLRCPAAQYSEIMERLASGDRDMLGILLDWT